MIEELHSLKTNLVMSLKWTEIILKAHALNIGFKLRMKRWKKVDECIYVRQAVDARRAHESEVKLLMWNEVLSVNNGTI